MRIKEALARVIAGRDLGAGDMRAVMRQVMSGDATAAQIGGFLVALRVKGETIDEISAAAEVMRELATRVTVDAPGLTDVVGTGGDGLRTFNISTASMFVVAAAGGHVAKHGNRAASSRSGSADLLEAAGVNLALSPSRVAQCIRQLGVGFMFAPVHHGAMKHAIGPRRELAVRTIFNVLGPLTNPAGAPNQLIGVFSAELIGDIARVLQRLGSRHVMVVHGDDGMDEITLAAPTRVAELKDGRIREYTIKPGDFGLRQAAIDEIVVEDAAQSLAIIRRVFDGARGAARDILLLNAGAALYVAGRAGSIGDGVALAADTIAGGAAAERMEAFATLSRELAEEQGA